MKLVLGDQSPLAGGLLRLQALRGQGYDPQYNLHDTDAPWVVAGTSQPRIVRGFSDYWSLASRFPWAPESLGGGFAEGIAAIVKAPRGLSYLAGPKTSLTIRALLMNVNPVATALYAGLVGEEIAWAKRLCELAGKREPAHPDLVAQIEMLQSKPFELVKSLGRLLGGVEVGTSFDFFRAHPCRFASPATSEHYWIMGREACRYPYMGGTLREDQALIPRGKMLPIEDAAAGFTGAATALGYMDDAIALRDRVCPGTKIDFFMVSFDWRPSIDPFAVLWDPYVTRKRSRGQEPDSKERAKLEAAVTYWRTRPTVISYAYLGGELNPSITLAEY